MTPPAQLDVSSKALNEGHAGMKHWNRPGSHAAAVVRVAVFSISWSRGEYAVSRRSLSWCSAFAARFSGGLARWRFPQTNEAAAMKSRNPWPATALLALLPLLASAQNGNAGPPEIQRPPGTAQAVGALHTVRQIPEACTRIEGRFTGQADAPYDMRVVRTDVRCQPRAALVDFAQVQANAAAWKLNDRIQIPAAACPGQRAVVEVWRKAVSQPLERDGQGQVRIYLDEMRRQVATDRLAALPAYAVRLEMEGQPCR
jgi:hypothetical protein